MCSSGVTYTYMDQFTPIQYESDMLKGIQLRINFSSVSKQQCYILCCHNYCGTSDKGPSEIRTISRSPSYYKQII